MMHCSVIGDAGLIDAKVVKDFLATSRKISIDGRNLQSARPLPEGVSYYSGNLEDGIFLMKILQGVEMLLPLHTPQFQ